jgi:hypothetical protein
MLNAVWVAVVVALAAWVALAAVAVVALARFSRLVTETGRAVAGLRQRGDELIERGNAAVSRASEQLARTEAITASMDQVTADMAELTGRVAALAPLARMVADSARGPVGRVLAFGYGVNRALSLRRGAGGRAGASRGARARVPGPLADGHRKALPGVQAGSVAARREGR